MAVAERSFLPKIRALRVVVVIAIVIDVHAITGDVVRHQHRQPPPPTTTGRSSVRWLGGHVHTTAHHQLRSVGDASSNDAVNHATRDTRAHAIWAVVERRGGATRGATPALVLVRRSLVGIRTRWDFIHDQ